MPKTVHKWVKKGCPFIERGGPGKEWKFNSTAVIKWVREQDVEQALGTTPASMSLDDANLRNKIATAQLKEFELARIRGETVTIHDVVAIYEEDLAIVRSRILSIPGRLAQELASETDAMVIERAIKREVSAAPSDLSCDEDMIRSRSGA